MPVQADLTIGGQLRNVVMVANRNGFFYTLDRETGKLLVGQAVHRRLELGQGDRARRPADRPRQHRHAGQVPARQPRRHQFPCRPLRSRARAVFRDRARDLRDLGGPRKPTPPIALGVRVPSGGRKLVEGREQFAALRAIDPTTGERRWEHRYRPYPSTVSLDLTGGLMSTASGLRLHRRQRRLLLRLRCDDREGVMALSDRRAALGRGARYLHARRTAVGPHAAGLTFVAFALPR